MSKSPAWSARLRKFEKDEGGSVLMLFGLVVIVLFMFAGCGLDFARAQHASSKARAALDAATLAAAKAMREDPSMTDSQLLTLAQNFFTANIARAGVGGTTWNAVTFSPPPNRTTGTVKASVTGDVSTYFYRVAGNNYQHIPVSPSSAVTYNLVDVEVGLVLDVTGSMGQHGKMPDMKAAVGTLADILLPKTGPKNVKIGLAPYSASVNVGPYASIASGGRSKDGCVVERLSAGYRYTDVAPTSAAFGVKGDLATNNGSYVCPPSKVLPLTDDHDTIVNTVNTYSPGGCTGGHMGVTWGWNLISPNWSGVWPKAPAAYGDGKTRKAIILMTDGTFNTAYVNGGANCPTAGDTMVVNEAVKVCDAIKAAGIDIYTVGLRLSGEPNVALATGTLQKCASSAKHALLAENGDELKAAFTEIAVQLNNIRLTQ